MHETFVRLFALLFGILRLSFFLGLVFGAVRNGDFSLGIPGLYRSDIDSAKLHVTDNERVIRIVFDRCICKMFIDLLDNITNYKITVHQ